MPRGKYVNHKGRHRNFTSPEELAKQSSEEETSTEEEEEDSDGESGAAGTSKSATRAKPPKPRAKTSGSRGGKVGESSDEDDDTDEESSEGEDRDARKGVASLIEIENPNRVTKKATQKLNNLKLDEGAPTKPELTRREREQIEKQKARERYKKLHAAGKTTEAKADLARLALVRQQRAEAQAKREAERKSLEEKKNKEGGSKA